mmetsp:Transcript_14985/g.28635  ORF Transcript_14985/g.28635 Transcript_14985/m.28635 type:complete len:245 (-) Transcript_14985:432-1166(-)
MKDFVALYVSEFAVNVNKRKIGDLHLIWGLPSPGTFWIRIIIVMKGINVNGLVDLSFHSQVAVDNILDVASSRVTDFDIHGLVCSCESHIFNGDILHPTTHFTSNGNTCKNAVTCHIPNCDIYRRLGIIQTETVPSRLDCDTVVGSAIGRIFYEHISRAIWIPAICIGRSIWVKNMDIFDVDVVAVEEVICPKRRVAQSQIVHGNVSRMEKLHQVPSSDGFASIVMFVPPNLTIPINHGPTSLT